MCVIEDQVQEHSKRSLAVAHGMLQLLHLSLLWLSTIIGVQEIVSGTHVSLLQKFIHGICILLLWFDSARTGDWARSPWCERWKFLLSREHTWPAARRPPKLSQTQHCSICTIVNWYWWWFCKCNVLTLFLFSFLSCRRLLWVHSKAHHCGRMGLGLVASYRRTAPEPGSHDIESDVRERGDRARCPAHRDWSGPMQNHEGRSCCSSVWMIVVITDNIVEPCEWCVWLSIYHNFPLRYLLLLVNGFHYANFVDSGGTKLFIFSQIPVINLPQLISVDLMNISSNRLNYCDCIQTGETIYFVFFLQWTQFVIEIILKILITLASTVF